VHDGKLKVRIDYRRYGIKTDGRDSSAIIVGGAMVGCLSNPFENVKQR
jgi:hypothetical protein